MDTNHSTNGKIKLYGIDAASYIFHTKKGLAKLRSIFYLFCCCISISADISKITGLIQEKRDARFVKSYLLQERKIAHATVPRQFPTFEQQQYNYSCSAQALRQAARELGIKNFPDNNIHLFDGQSIFSSSAEEAIYGVTGNLLNESKESRLIEPHQGGGAYPANILKCARLLGLNGRFYCSSLMTRIYMNIKYKKEWNEAKTCSSVNYYSPPELHNCERLIILLRKGSDYHFIMQRPDKTCYDPGTGNSYITLKEYSTAEKWKPTGVSILVFNPEGYPTPDSSTTTSPLEASTYQAGSQGA